MSTTLGSTPVTLPTAVTLPGLVAELVALRHAGGYRFKVPQRVLCQFVEHCRQHGYPDGSITKEAVHGFLYGRHLRASTVRSTATRSCCGNWPSTPGPPAGTPT